MLDNVFQYTQNIFIRYKLYKVYIAPIIECFLPAYLSAKYMKRHDLAVFQHKCLCLILGVSYMCPVEKVEITLGERSIIEKTRVVCQRLKRKLDPTFTTVQSCNLRGGRSQISQINNENIDPLDFCHRLVTIYDHLKTLKFAERKKFSHEVAKKGAKALRLWTRNKMTKIKAQKKNK